MGIVIPGLRGLGAKDRTPEEQKEIQDINNMIAGNANDSTSTNNNPTTDSISFDTSHIYGFHSAVPIDKSFDNEMAQMSLEQYFGRLSDELVEKKKKDEIYYSSIDELRNATHSGMDVNSKYTEEIKNIAENVSPYYKKFRNTDYLTLTNAEWNELAAQYAGMYNAYGEDEANKQLNQSIKDNVAGNQPTLQKAWYALAGMGADAAGSMISGAGMLYGLEKAITGDYEKNPYLNGAENFITTIMDNEVTRYGSDIVKYGTIRKLDEARELGIPATEIMNTAEQDQQLLSINTPFELIQQGGFTVASMGMAAGVSKVTDLMFKGVKKGAMGIVMNTSENLAKAKKTIEIVRNVENFHNRVIVPGIVGSVEGVVEGLETKRNIEESGRDAAYAAQREIVENAVMNKLKNYTEVRKDNESMPEYYDKDGNKVDIEALYNSTWAEMQPKLDASLDNVEAMASKAGVGNFLVNSMINGFINATYKAGLQSERVQDALRQGKLTGWAFGNERMNISGGFGNAKVTPGITNLGKAWAYIKEPLGEFKEEYLQTQSDAFFTGLADNNIHSFIENRYRGDAKKAIGDAVAEDWAAALTELGESLVSKESMKSGVYGALSSIVGTPALGRRTNKLDANGNVILKKDAEGNIRTRKGKPIAEKTLFGRGQSADGDKETSWEAFQRWMPWRSGLTANIRKVRENNDAAKEQAQALEDWLNDPKNKDKFDGLAGSLAWSREMGQSAAKGNEFNYRNSKLGKMLNDIFMLQKTEGSELYKSIMDQLTEVSTMQRDSDLAKQYVQSIKDNVNTQDPNKSDDEIFEELKSNASNMLDMMAKVKQESNKLEKLLGNIDDDTKQSLIFGQLSIDDWKKRKEKLGREIADISIENSKDPSTNLSDKQKSLLASYGSLENARKVQKALQKDLEETKKDISKIKDRAEAATDSEKRKLSYLNVYKKSLIKELSKFKELDNLPEDANLTLNEQEIMALDPISRANMLKRGKEQLYKKLNDSTGEESKEDSKEQLNGLTVEQKAVVDNLVAQGMAIDKDFLSKVIDAGKIQSSMNTFLKQYNSILMSSEGLRSYAAMAKQQAADELTRERALELGKIQNYTEFVSAITNAFNKGTEHDSRVIGRTLRNNENYKKFIEQGNIIEDLMNTLDRTDKFRNMDGNTVDLLAQTAYYLYSEGVDLNDTNAVWDALTATDDRGYNKFVSFVDSENQGLDISQQTRFTSLEEVFQTYKDVLSQAQYNKAQQEKIEKPIEVNPNTEQKGPVQPPTPQKESITSKNTPQGTKVSVGDKVEFEQDGNIIRGTVNTISEDGNITIQVGENSAYAKRLGDFDEGTIKFVQDNPVENPAESPQPQPQPQGVFGDSTIVGKSPNDRDKVTDEAIEAAPAANPLQQARQDEKKQVGTQIEQPTASSKEKQEPQPTNFVAKVRKVLEGNAKIKNYEKGAEIANSIMDNMSSDDLESFENLQVAVEREAKKLLTSGDNEDNQMAVYLLRQAVANSNPDNPLRDSDRKIETNAAQISSVNMDYVRKKHPNSPILKFSDSYGMNTYVASGKLSSDKDVFFVSDEELAKEMSNSYDGYDSKKDLPIVAVVEDENGTYEVDGKKYQPIAIMPSTGNAFNSGSDRMKSIRDLADTKGRKLVMYNGKPLRTKTYGKKGVKATPADDNTREYNSTVDLIIDLIDSSDERTRVKTQSTQERKDNPWYTRVKKAFMKMLDVVVDKKGYKMMAYTQPNMKDSKFQPIYMKIRPINETVSPYTGGSLLDAVNSGNNETIVNFNSRTRGVARKIDEFLKGIPTADKATANTLDEIRGKAAGLQRDISDYLAPTREGAVWKYEISPADLSVSKANGEATFVLTMKDNDGNEVFLTNFSRNMSVNEVAANIIKNLTTENGDWRIVDGNMLATWQVDYRDVNKMHNGDQPAERNISELIDDDIFEMAASSLTYNDTQVQLNSPFKEDNTPRYPYVTNNDNADTTPTNGQPVVGTDQTQTSNGAIVDAGSGTVLQGSQKPMTNPAYERAKEIADRIVEDSKKFELTTDERAYVNTQTGRAYNRVTSMISADENGSRFDESSGFGLPSTNIGNTVDEFVRDFFADTLKKKDNGDYDYPNASQKQWEAFVKELEGLRANFIRQGITIVPKDVRVTGTVKVTDDMGQTYDVNVAGTLDLLGYDKNGNFYIFDMKTIHDANKLYSNADKWSMQTSLYQKFLKDTYGIDVKARIIIPINVNYSDPSRVNYTQGEGNQLIMNDKPFENAAPKLLNKGLFSVGYKEPVINYNKLTPDEKASISSDIFNISALDRSKVDFDITVNKNEHEGNKTLKIYLKGQHDKGWFELVKDRENNRYSVHFKTGDADTGEIYGSTKEERNILFDALRKALPDNTIVSTWGNVSDKGADAIDKFGRGMTKIGLREVKDRQGNQRFVSVYEKVTPDSVNDGEIAAGVADLAKNGGTEDGSSMEGNPVEASVPESSTPHEDTTTGIIVDDNVFGGMFGDNMFGMPTDNPGTVNTPVSGKIPYNSLTQEQKDRLTAAGVTEYAYNNMNTQEEIDKLNDCLGLK